MTQMAVGSMASRQASSSWSAFLGQQQRFNSFLTWVLAAITVLKGLRAPSTWAYTQAQLNYSFGFIRRGLVGATLGSLFGLNRFAYFTVFTYITLTVALALLAILVRKSALSRVLPEHLAALLASSFALTYLVHLAGFFDLLLLSFAIVFLLIRGVTQRLLLLPFLLGIGLLVHENFLLLFVPVMLLTFVLDEENVRGYWIASLAGLMALAMTFVIAFRATMTPERALLVRRAVEARVDGPLNPGFWGVLTTSMGDSLRVIARFLGDGYVWTHVLLPTAVIFLPVLGVLTYLNFHLSQRLTNQRFLPYLCMVAGLSPLLLSALGIDTARWAAEATTASVLVLCSLCRRAGDLRMPLSLPLRNLILLLIAVNLATGDQLMDGTRVNNYPFTDLFVHGAKSVLGRR